MAKLMRFQDLILGELEQSVLETLWAESPLSPGEVHSKIGVPRDISINTISSALKRLFDKGLLNREKVSHSFVYRPEISRAGLQKELIDAMVSQFSNDERSGFLAAFVDLAEAEGEETLRRLEVMIAERLEESKS